MKIKTIDLFAGAGGLTEGFEQSGYYETIAAVEWEKAPCDNLKKRLIDKWHIQDGDARVLRFDMQRTQELFEGWQDDKVYGSSMGLDYLISNAGGIDLIIGGPPCQAYSIAGRARDEHGMRNDYRNYLFESYLEVVKRYKPKAFVFENVPGLLSAKPGNKPIVELIQQGFKSIGYMVLEDLRQAIIDFSEYGVPQNRKRVIILGLSQSIYGKRCEEVLEKFYKTVLPTYKTSPKRTVRDAISDLPKLYPLSSTEKYNGKRISHSLPNPMVANHIARWQSSRDIEIFRLLTTDIESGRNLYSSADALKKLYTEKTGKQSNVHKYHVLRWDEPSNLIPAHLFKDGLRHIHPDPEQARTITPREAARLQTFPDDYIFISSPTDVFKMIGNAVPPLFANILARAIKKIL